jgi:phasin family protein
MAKTNTSNGFMDLPSVIGDLRIPGIDAGLLVETQRKNIEAMTQAQQLAVEGMRAVTQRQAEMLQQAFGDASALWRDLLQPATPEERMARSADAAKQAFERSVAGVRELNELGAKAGGDVFSVFARRLSESFDEVRLLAKKQASA